MHGHFWFSRDARRPGMSTDAMLAWDCSRLAEFKVDLTINSNNDNEYWIKFALVVAEIIEPKIYMLSLCNSSSNMHLNCLRNIHSPVFFYSPVEESRTE